MDHAQGDVPAAQDPSAARRSAYATVGTALGLLSDRRLADIVAATPVLGAGIGGRAAELDVDGVRVFVKRVPLTDLELRPEHERSTANLFELPLFYQYGVGSAGFGAWRELAAHLMTTGWVLRGGHPGFPLLYHWRILPDQPPTGFADAFGGIEGAVAHWEGSAAVRRRLQAVGRSSASLVLFLEHVPHTLAAWLADHEDPGTALPWMEDALTRGTAFMSDRGLVHFDAHFHNLLTDGRQVYFADFGLALSSRFELSAKEAEFLSDHLLYDRCYVPTHLLRHHLLDRVRGDVSRETYVREWGTGHRRDGVPPRTAAFLDRHARTATVLDDFHHRLLTRSKRTPFPAEDLRAALNASPAARS
ncbi:protein kinase family protein [Streptomyces sp. NPDC048419]|uniref:protein kinase family protein n=1 Tax=Streptomyces sp. NPDC048419 TaxID=3365547 RepID=UPI00371404DC